MPTPIFVDGPLTVTPAKTYTQPLANVVDGSGTIGASLGAPVTRYVFVALHNIPGMEGEEVMTISGATDLGAMFTQGQLNNWMDLKKAIQLGYLTASVAGTTPNNTPR